MLHGGQSWSHTSPFWGLCSKNCTSHDHRQHLAFSDYSVLLASIRALQTILTKRPQTLLEALDTWNRKCGKRVFAIVDWLRFPCVESVIAMEFLLELDNSLAIAEGKSAIARAPSLRTPSLSSFPRKINRGNQSIHLHRSRPLLETGLDRTENRYGRYGFASFTAFPYLWSESAPLKIFFSCSLGGGGGGRYFSVPRLMWEREVRNLQTDERKDESTIT